MNTQLSTLPGFVKPDNGDQVFFYEQDFYVLSNFSAFNLLWQGHTFATSEHAYHWEKFWCNGYGPGWPVALRIKDAASAHEAFKIAEQNKHLRYARWDEVKVDTMRRILRAKAAQHEYVRRKLLATGDRQLIEDSWRDDFWGWGQNRSGQNMLGKLWMELRAELRQTPAGVQPSAEAVNNVALVQAIAKHIDGWKSATFGWQDNSDPVVAERNKATAIEAHAAECIRRIRTTLADGVKEIPDGR